MGATLAELLDAHRAGRASPQATVATSYAHIRDYDDPAVFITLRAEADAVADARQVEADGHADRPLYGVPIAVKDNIDVKGMPTTVACPAFAYTAHADATSVARLRRAGAVVVGKTNLDQFATGLNGTRTPYGIPRNPLKRGLIPGGSSSGSAVAVATGLVPVSLGSDTAGSGRVPAMLNNIVGLKPSHGLVSTRGLVPACRTLDCIPVFALTVDDAWATLAVMAGFDEKDPYSRAIPLGSLGNMPAKLKIGVPAPGERLYFGAKTPAAAYERALALLESMGATIVNIDIEPFYETARLLYEGPWLAERYVTVRPLLASSPEALHPVTREVIVAGSALMAADAFAHFYQLEELRRVADRIFREVDALVVPTAPRTYTVDQMKADPIQLNSRLGTYTNFVNLLDLCGLAVPASLASDGTPFGVTFLAPSGHDALLASIGRVFHARTGLPLGALGAPQPPLAPIAAAPREDEIAVAVVGAHLSGMPLNGELRRLNARFLETTTTTSDYRLFALPGTRPPKPGMLRVPAGAGAKIEVELWALTAEAFGRFVADIPAPLSIGTLALAGGRGAKGFLVEAEAVTGARDISEFGGWRAYMAQQKVPA